MRKTTELARDLLERKILAENFPDWHKGWPLSKPLLKQRRSHR